MCFFFILCKNKHFGFLSNDSICVHTTAPPQKMSTETTKKTTDAQQNGAGKLCFLLLCLTRTAHLDWRVILTIVFFLLWKVLRQETRRKHQNQVNFWRSSSTINELTIKWKMKKLHLAQSQRMSVYCVANQCCQRAVAMTNLCRLVIPCYTTRGCSSSHSSDFSYAPLWPRKAQLYAAQVLMC